MSKGNRKRSSQTRHAAQPQLVDGAPTDGPVNRPNLHGSRENSQKRHFENKQIRVAIWLNVITGAGAVVALFGLGILYLSITHADESTADAYRAWLKPYEPMLMGINGGAQNWPPNKGQQIRFSFPFSNAGKTPALQVSEFHERFWIDVKNNRASIAGKDLVLPPNDTCQRMDSENKVGVVWPTTVPPDSPLFAGARDDDAIVADEGFLGMKKLLGYHGCMSYMAFGQLRYSAFCEFLNPTISKASGMWIWNACIGDKQNYAS